VLAGTVGGEGTLNVAGFYDELATVAADLDVANVTLGPSTILVPKADGHATVNASRTTMTVTPTLAPGLTLINTGALDFGANDYFTCSTCTVANLAGATIELNNPDGSFLRSFTINAGTFDNSGTIKLTGLLPGTAINFGKNVTVIRKGQAVLQHCWGPEDGVPFDLEPPSLLTPGIHTAYVGLTAGEGFSVGSSFSYSILLGCAHWYQLTQVACTPTNTKLPTVTGTSAVGQTLDADHGLWAPADAITGYSYQWMRCTSASLSNCTKIDGETGPQYTVQPADENKWLTVGVKATSTWGTSDNFAYAPPVGPVP
jgi:hypothetical protein